MKKNSLLLSIAMLCAIFGHAQQSAEPLYLRTEANGVKVYQTSGNVDPVTEPIQQPQSESERTPRTIEEYTLEEVQNVLIHCEEKLAEARASQDTAAVTAYESDLKRLLKRQQELTQMH